MSRHLPRRWDVQTAHELRGLADLLPQLVQEVVLDTVRDTHFGISDNVFRAVPASTPIKRVHDGVAGVVYGTLSGITGAVGRLVGRSKGPSARAVGRDWGPTGASAGFDAIPSPTIGGQGWKSTVATLNGILGDQLVEQDNPLAIDMAVRVAGRDVPVEAEALRSAFPDAGQRIAVLVHGLTDSETCWAHRQVERRSSYPQVLREAGITPVLLRYNSGRHISDNAVDLAELIEGVVRNWPVDVGDVVLIGHSMGGLVIRGAGVHALSNALRWPDLTSQVVMLGSPHSGAWLERVANVGAWLLSVPPQSAAFGRVLRRRSSGIKDLRHGYVVGTDWEGSDPDALGSLRATPTDRVGAADHHVVAATLGRTREQMRSRAFGDLMVNWGSGVALGQEWARTASVTHLGATNHLGLLNHPQVALLLAEIAAEGRPC